MHIARNYRAHKDWWFMVICLLLAISACLALYSYFHKGALPTNTNESKQYGVYAPDQGPYEIIPPDPQYPPPAKEQRAFDKTYDAGQLQYNLIWSVRNLSRSPMIGQHEFTLELYNTKNEKINASESEIVATTIGCIAKDGPYQTMTVQPKSTGSFGPYERKQIKFSIDVSCLYLGTADGKHFWRIY